MMQAAQPELILASASTGRAALLAAAGLAFRAVPAPIDEAEIKRTAAAEGLSDADTALLLAEMKASRISRRHPQALVIGADQILVCNGEWYDKPGDVDGVMENLLRLRGQTHTLVSAVCCWQGGASLWQHCARCELTMRDFSTEFLEAYLAQDGEACRDCVGGYRLEGLGLHLFAHVQGEHAAVLGLPMLPLLAFLRQVGVLLA